jgi:hypothetical protein
VTNEATDAYHKKVLKRSRIRIKSRIRSKDRRPAVDRENTTHQPTADREIVTNEATSARENAMNEPTLAAFGEGGQVVEMTAGKSDLGEGEFQEAFDREKTLEWIREGLASIAAMQAEKSRELTGESRREAKESKAARPSRRDRTKNGNTADRAMKRAAGTKPRTTGNNEARTIGDSAELVSAGSGPNKRDGPGRDWNLTP